uniref:NADH-ubiquinone oxidoreductase chain 6 n=1 Tax=Timema californicum TaxID=61474 RepID=Q2Q1H2_TIMCA|nr:NADH dehydrogenase subunit 6 [Timema californicum]
MITSLMMLTITASTFMMMMKHPLAIGLMIIMQTTLISLLMGSTTSTFWLSYLLFLIFLGGMLVLFIYVSSIASNEMFSVSVSTFATSLALSVMFMMMMIKMNSNIMYDNMDAQPIMSMSELEMIMMKFYNLPNNLMTIMLVLYLFLTMIAINKITNIHLGPLRTKN